MSIPFNIQMVKLHHAVRQQITISKQNNLRQIFAMDTCDAYNAASMYHQDFQ